MDVTKQIQLLIEALQADKSTAQPWKNYAISDAMRLQALIEKSQSMSFSAPPKTTSDVCICQGGKLSVNCPVHGIN